VVLGKEGLSPVDDAPLGRDVEPHLIPFQGVVFLQDEDVSLGEDVVGLPVVDHRIRRQEAVREGDDDVSRGMVGVSLFVVGHLVRLEHHGAFDAPLRRGAGERKKKNTTSIARYTAEPRCSCPPLLPS